MDHAILGVEIGATKLQWVLGDASGRIRERKRLAVGSGAGAADIRRMLEQESVSLDKEKIKAVAVGYGGPVDWRTGVIRCSHQVDGWNGFGLARWLEDLLGAATKVENDSNTAALAEAVCGAGKGERCVFYTNSGSGVGGGMVVDGRLYHGASPGEVEFGHLRLDRSGRTVEDACSGWAVDRRIHRLCREVPTSWLARATKDMHGGEARMLGAALTRNDPVARRVLDETADDLAYGLSHVVHLFHPDVIVLGGGLSLVGEPWRKAVAERLPALVMEAFSPGPPVRLAALGEDVVPVGALLLAARQAC